MNAPKSARLASSATGFLGDCDRKTWIMRIDWSKQLGPGDPGSRHLAAQIGVGERLRGRLGHHLRETEEVALDRGRVGVDSPQIDQVSDRVQSLAALPQQLADAGVLQVAGLDQPAPDDHGPLIFLDIAIRLADREQLVEREDQLGGLLLDDLEILDDLARLSSGGY